MKTIVFILLLAVGAYSDSCFGRCGDKDSSKSCQCNSSCKKYHDCCSDYFDICFSCQDRCGEAYLSAKPCQCNNECASHGNCCDDYDQLCGDGDAVTDDEIRDLTEALLSFDINNVGSLIEVNPQGKGTSGDLAPGPFFTSVPPEALSGPTISALIALQDNYIPDVNTREIEEPGEAVELDNFLDAILDTKVMQMTSDFLYEKKLCTGSMREKVKEIWFQLYPRGNGGALSSSGFEHSFVGEIKNGAVSGFHNWVHFYNEEKNGNLDYGGWSKMKDFDEKGMVLEDHFEWQNYEKQVGSSFIGTSPEFEIAVYTLCFLTRPDSLCPVRMRGQQFKIQTWTYQYAGKTLVGSAYPYL
ncbi:uridylate-specific endoribonuclease-like [Palaemon carinicauda]|uniref:uridylate-specific endoribonuclease-like n=1 Tax=Palaemon carinicauda TaxID=392227 RepID=UPI0035B6622C